MARRRRSSPTRWCKPPIWERPSHDGPSARSRGHRTPIYGKSHILHGVSLEVREGEIVTLLGRNGAGKTTTLRSLIGLTPPAQGHGAHLRRDDDRWPPYRVAALGVGYVPEGRRIFSQPHGRGKPQGSARAARALDDRARLSALSASRRAQGATRAASFPAASRKCWRSPARCMLNPKLLMLDEPSQGLAPLIVREVFDVVAAAPAPGHFRPPGRAERARGGRDRRPRLCARRRRDRPRRGRERPRGRRSAHARSCGRQRCGVG